MSATGTPSEAMSDQEPRPLLTITTTATNGDRPPILTMTATASELLTITTNEHHQRRQPRRC